MQLVQFCRLLVRLAQLVDAPLPPRIDAAIARYISREIHDAPLLKGAAAPALLRLSLTSATGCPLVSNYAPLCALDLAATHLLRSTAPSPSAADPSLPDAGASARDPHESSAPDATAAGSASPAAPRKRQRVAPPPGSLQTAQPAWLSWLLRLDAGSARAFSTTNETCPPGPDGSGGAPASLPPLSTAADAPVWSRRLLLLAALLRRIRSPLSTAAVSATLNRLLPMATRAIDEPELQLCALTALLALLHSEAASRAAPLAPSTACARGTNAHSLWEAVWAQVWAAERARWAAEPVLLPASVQGSADVAGAPASKTALPTAAGASPANAAGRSASLVGTAALLAELRQRLLSQLCRSGLVRAATVAKTANEAAGGCVAAASAAAIPQLQLASSLVTAAQALVGGGGAMGAAAAGGAGTSVDGAQASTPATRPAPDMAPARGAHMRAVDAMGGRAAAPFDDGAYAVSDCALLLHPAALVCCESSADSASAAASHWAASRLQIALAAAGLPAESLPLPPPSLLPLSSLASSAAAAAAVPPATAHAWCTLGWCGMGHGGDGTSEDWEVVGGPQWHTTFSYVAQLGRGGSLDDDACAILQCEVELFQLDAICTEAMRASSPNGGAEASAQGSGSGGVRRRTGANGGGSGDGAAALRGATTGGGAGGALTTLPASASIELFEAAAELTKWLKAPSAPILSSMHTNARSVPQSLTTLQRLVCAAMLLSLPLPATGATAQSAATEAKLAPSTMIRLADQMLASVKAVCEALTHGVDTRPLALLPPLIRALHSVQRAAMSRQRSRTMPVEGAEPRADVDAIRRRAAANSLHVIAKCVTSHVLASVRQPHSDEDALDAHALLDAMVVDGEESMRSAEDDDAPTSASTRGFSPSARAWLCALEALCGLDTPQPRSARPAPGASGAGGDHFFSLKVDTVMALLQAAEHRHSALRASTSLAIEYAVALLPYDEATVRERVLNMVDRALASSPLRSPRLLRLSIAVATRILTVTAQKGACAASSSGARDGKALQALLAATLRGCAALVLRSVEGWEDQPLEDASATALAVTAYLELGALVPPAYQAEVPQPRILASGLLGLLRLRRATRHADLLRLQAVVLPLIPRLFALRPTSELLPPLRDATRSALAQPTHANAGGGSALPQAGTLLAASLTATAVLTCCPDIRRFMLRELCHTPQVILGRDATLLSLVRARCCAAGGLHTLMVADLTWLVAVWLECGHALLAFPHHWLEACAVGSPVSRTPSGGLASDAIRDAALQRFYQRHFLSVLPPVLERAFGTDSAASRRAQAEVTHLERLMGAPLSTLVVAGLPTDVDSPPSAAGCVPQLLGQWLPLHALSSKDQPHERRWDQISARLEQLLKAGRAPAVDDSVGHAVLSQMPRISHALSGSCDGILLAMLHGLACPSEVQLMGSAGGAQGGPETQRNGLPVAAVRKAVDLLASAHALRDGTHLMCESPMRVLDLLLILHHVNRSSLGTHTPHSGVGSPMLTTLELMVQKNGLLPQMLKPPDTVSDAAKNAFPLAAIARLLQHATLSLLPSQADLGAGPTTRHAAACGLQRCCAVLQAVLHAVTNPEGEGRNGLTKEAKDLLLRSHCAILIDTMLPLATAAVAAATAVTSSSSSDAAVVDSMTTAATDAAKLIDLAVKALPEKARATLPAFPRDGLFFPRDLATSCDASRMSVHLYNAMIDFARIDQLEASGSSLRSRLADLRQRLKEAAAAAEAAGLDTWAKSDMSCFGKNAPHVAGSMDGPTATAAAMAAWRLLLLCRAENDRDRQLLIAECLASLASAGLSAAALASQMGKSGTSSWREESVSWHDHRDLGEGLLVDALRRSFLVLHRSLSDSREEVMLFAARALQEVLSISKRTHTALNAALEQTRRQSPLTSRELEAFRHVLRTSAGAAMGSATLAASQARAAIEEATAAAEKAVPLTPKGDRDIASRALWLTHGKSAEEWLCTLTQALLSGCRESTLRPLRLLAARIPQLARVLLGPALLDVLQGDTIGGERSRAIAAALTAIFDEALGTAPTSEQLAAVGTLVPVVIFLRKCAMHARHSRKERAASTVHAWIDALWPKLDLARAAAAAHAAGCPISAFMLLEISAEVFDTELVPQVILSSPSLCRQYAEVSAALPAPDCARNVATAGSTAAGGDVASTLRVLTLRGDHASALSLIDSVQQQLMRAGGTSAQLAGDLAPHRHDIGSVAALRLKGARTLRSIGCTALCATVLRHSPEARSDEELAGVSEWQALGGGVVGAEVRELQAECAWRLGKWGGAAPHMSDWGATAASAAAGLERSEASSAGLHELLHASLTAMQQGRPRVAEAALRRAAIDQVRRLGGGGEEGGKRVTEHIVSLRMIADVREVACALEAHGAAAAAAAAVQVSYASTQPATQMRHQRHLLAIAGGEFEVVEPVLALRAVLLRRFAPAEVEALSRLLTHAAGSARAGGSTAAAASLVAEAASLPATASTAMHVQWEQAQLLWQLGGQGQPCARAMALATASQLAERAAALVDAVGIGGVSAHERVALAQACRVYAAWGVAEGQCGWEQAVALHERALAMCGESTAAMAEERCETYAAYAAWLEAEHRASTQQRGVSPDDMRSSQLYELARKELEAAHLKLDALPPAPRPAGSRDASQAEALQRRMALLRSHIEAYEQSKSRQRESQLALAANALRQHALCARSGDSHDHSSLFAIVGLWLEYGGRLSEAAQQLASLPTHKLLPLIHQLTCRLGALRASDHDFQTALRQVLMRVARGHLHTVLPHLLALSYGERFAPGEETPSTIDRGQLEAAKELVKELRLGEPKAAAAGAAAGVAAGAAASGSRKQDAAAVVQATELLHDFYLQLAWAGKKETTDLIEAARKREGHRLPHLKELMAGVRERKASSHHPFSMRKGAELFDLVQKGHASQAALPTHGGGLGTRGDGDIIFFDRFGPATASSAAGGGRGRRAAVGEAEFSTAGGVNLPKIVFCYGHDGRMHKQLVKGRDDLRGDAVMQQVFGLLNVLLSRDAATRQRALRMRTYRVVPLAPTAGVLQWVDDSMALSQYLTGYGVSAHERYRPHDWSHKKCRDQMASIHKAVAENQRPPSARLAAYREVELKLRPVFHHFFLERWHAPAAWFSRRLAYASSVAAGSMIGFVLGLGDRHSSNILIDTRSAELVHIDLGIAFEQGRLLKTPECVPFRLTRDIEDGLGVSGVEGVLRGAAEHTMRVLRAHSDALVTILEVIVRNPLYRWSLDPTRAANAGGTGHGGGGGGGGGSGGGGGGVAAEGAATMQNREAERALLRIQDKLAGRVAGTNEVLAVEGQVRALLDEARDPGNLSKMYDGWAGIWAPAEAQTRGHLLCASFPASHWSSV